MLPAAEWLAMAMGAATPASPGLQGPDWGRLLTLQDYNTRVVLAGTALLGLAAGVLGCFTLLRKRALMGDALSHATLPGIGLAFLLGTRWGADGRSLPLLLAGAVVTGVLGLAVILFLRARTRIKEDTALGIVLSVFFGAGVAVLGVVQNIGAGHAAGLESFIYGKAAALVASDAWLIGGAAVLVLAACTLFFKELRLLCFDPDYTRSAGWPVLGLDSLLMGLVIVITVIGLQAVGLILIIALLIIPAAAARFWSDRLPVMMGVAGVQGAVSGLAGAGLSAVLPDLPSGAMIVLTATALFGLSLLCGPARGVLVRRRRQRGFEARVRRQHLLRALFELSGGESAAGDLQAELPRRRVPLADLLRHRTWTARSLRREISRAAREGLVAVSFYQGPEIALTVEGWHEAAQVVRQHRLWELYLITHADIAPSHVDRDADAIEHVLGPEMVRQLEALLAVEQPRLVLLSSPHLLEEKP